MNDPARAAFRGIAGRTHPGTPSRPGMLLTVASALTLVQPSPASAAMTKIAAVGVFDDAFLQGGCDPPPAPFADFVDYPPIVITGDLEGCWYTKIDTFKDNGKPSGVYLETGRELFIGELNGEPIQFTTTYKFESKWDPDITTGVEVHGRCQHPIAEGSEKFGAVTGRLDFKDIVTDGSFAIRGHIRRL